MTMTGAVEHAKRRAAERAVDEIQSNTTIGLGTGSTMRYALEELGRRLSTSRLRAVVGVPTSNWTAATATRLGIPLAGLAQGRSLALAIDGADEIDPALNLVKGRGGALLREKIVAASAADLVIVADASKLVDTLGSRSPIPIEVIPFALPLVLDRLSTLPGHAQPRQGPDGQPARTDEGNAIVDYVSGPIDDPHALDRTLLAIPGIVDHGLFLGMARRAVIASDRGISLIEA